MMRPSTLEELDRELEAVSVRLTHLWTSADDPCAPPVGGGWSLAQCLAHLALSTCAYLPAWHEAVQNPDAPRRSASRALQLDAWGRVLVWFLEPPPKVRFRTKCAFEAPSSPAALEEFLQSQRELAAVTGRARAFAIDRIRIRSAYDPRVRYSVWSSLVTTLAHQRRHVWQAERLLLQRPSGEGGAGPTR